MISVINLINIKKTTKIEKKIAKNGKNTYFKTF